MRFRRFTVFHCEFVGPTCVFIVSTTDSCILFVFLFADHHRTTLEVLPSTIWDGFYDLRSFCFNDQICTCFQDLGRFHLNYGRLYFINHLGRSCINDRRLDFINDLRRFCLDDLRRAFFNDLGRSCINYRILDFINYLRRFCLDDLLRARFNDLTRAILNDLRCFRFCSIPKTFAQSRRLQTFSHSLVVLFDRLVLVKRLRFALWLNVGGSRSLDFVDVVLDLRLMACAVLLLWFGF